MKAITTAILDRLLHRSITINIQGKDFRLRLHHTHGLTPSPLDPTRGVDVMCAGMPFAARRPNLLNTVREAAGVHHLRKYDARGRTAPWVHGPWSSEFPVNVLTATISHR
ncbi:MAG: hypothetical protein GXP48_04140 [Acidobacteria bacterium]|nr:hypothetical protein [Acidobacteriota bacterium]